ncbi:MULTISPECIES: trigger factor [Chryseobacterium]|jgi:trigger factor|uniref:Trigger factor n=1 Tax=Chryseobacterium indoltheticum TaxID=254 RepID=A0A381JQE7_9FLAO|nr:MULTISPECIES: trigger factor [Chryseobacterium]AZA62530.1 trigger factor [Chryseobacterium indoltheticum]AZA75439.1 trigger factor [Chryseobacterium indoltheticum]MDQ8143093.1 trigger factor [Chryseobacterium sp. CFS15]QQQ27821.1 trigger factor [Chryseobacterium indoltheticum]SIQ67540.1 trigger factor [Chryseobacterium indoltheticum]
MKVTAKNHDDVSALLTVTLEKSDYKEKVEKQLINYAKNAQVPGFRKGKVPLSMVRKQYEAGIAFEEINKQVSDALNNYINENKLRLVGQPVPQPVNDFNHNAEQLEVAFEVGYEPEFTIDLAKYEAPHYKVSASEKEINKSIENMQKRFAEQVPQDKITKDSYINFEITQVVEEGAEGEHNHAPKMATITAENKAAFKLLKGLKMDESVKVSKETLAADEDLAKELGFAKEEVEHLHHAEVEVKVKDFYSLNLAELNQELFDKVYGEGNIKTEEELKDKVKAELDEYFQQNADVHFVNKVLEQVSEKEEVKLPESFLTKWLIFSNQNIQSEEQAQAILEAEKTQLKYQIIEGKLMSDNNIQLDYADVLAQAEQLVKNQLAIYGIHHLGDEEVQKYAAEMLKDQEQVRQISSEVAMAKLKDVILEKATKKETEISHDEFLEELKK